MAIANDRDLTSELHEGFTDGSVMKLGGGMRGGIPTSLVHDASRQNWPQYGMLGVADPQYVDHPALKPCGCDHG